MKNLRFFQSILGMFILVFVIIACSKDFEFDKISTDNLSGEWAFPLINSSISFADILDDSTGIITTNDEGFVTLVYESDSLVSMNGSARTVIPDQQKSLYEPFSINYDTMIAGLPIPPIPLEFDFQFEMIDENHRIDTLYLKNGEYKIGLTTNLNLNDADVTLSVSNFVHTVTGNVLEVTFDLDNPNQEVLTMFETIDLSEYYVQFDNEVEQNKIIIDAFITGTTDDNPNLSPYYLDLHNEFNGIEFNKFYGFIGENIEHYSDTLDISIFNSVDLSDMEFGENTVRIKLDIYNSLGVPIELDISKFMAYNTVNLDDSLELNIEPSYIDIEYPTIDAFNQYVLTEITTSNFNINEMLDLAPNKLVVRMDGMLNDNMGPNTINYFADNSNMYVDAAVEIELFGGISSFEIVDTLDFDPASFDGFDAVEFMIEITNGFPIESYIQLDFVDDDFNLLYSLIPQDERLIPSGIVGPAPKYEVLEPQSRKTFVELNRDGLDLIEQASKIHFRANLSTEDGQYVKIYDDCNIHLQLGAKVIYMY
jgi:hypothetical protein